jgi:two-component system sporulation sensor kinase C
MLNSAHEIRNFLTVINGLAELGQRHPERSADYFRQILEQTDRVEQVLRRLFAKSRPAAGQIDLNAIVTPLHQALLALPGPPVETCMELEDGLPLGPRGDAGDLYRALLNLCLNARKAMASGGRLTIKTSSSPGLVSVCIADTGCGMSREAVAQIWNGRLSADGEHGRGLMIVKGTIDELGGRVDVATEEGVGTTFRISLPVPAGMASAR